MDDPDKQQMWDLIRWLYAEVKDDLTDDELRQIRDALAPAIRRMAQRN